MNVEAVDLGEEIGVRVQLRLDLAPVVIGRPVPRERLHEGELHTLRRVRDGFLFRESCRLNAPAHFVEFRVCHLETKWTNRGLVGSLLGASFGNSGWCHADLLKEAVDRMAPEAPRSIYQTMVSTTPSYRPQPRSHPERTAPARAVEKGFGPQSHGDALLCVDTLNGPETEGRRSP